jgi:hypothetical protein
MCTMCLQHHERFEFHPVFYEQEIVPFMDLFKTFFEMRMEELYEEPEIEHEHSPYRDIQKFSEPVNSFKYMFMVTTPGAVKALYDTMLGKEIASDTLYLDFKNTFDNKKVVNPIILNLKKGAAYYFVHQLKEEGKIYDNDIWVAAAKVFILKDHPDYDLTELAHQKQPKDPNVIERINMLVNSL